MNSTGQNNMNNHPDSFSFGTITRGRTIQGPMGWFLSMGNGSSECFHSFDGAMDRYESILNERNRPQISVDDIDLGF